MVQEWRKRVTLGDLLKRVDIEKDKDKMILLDCGDGWANLTMTNNEFEPIYFREVLSRPFSDGG